MKFTCLFLLLLTFNAIEVSAQAYTLCGLIKISDGRTNIDAIVQVENQPLIHVDPNGSFCFIATATGEYTLLISGPDLDTLIHSIHVLSDTSITLEAELKTIELRDVVITATRTERSAKDVPVPVKVITAEQIEKMGAVRLSDVLREQTGLTLISDHGTGIQLQGMSSEYTLILLNGQPMIGRTAGTFDLSRVAVGNIKRIEIIKGPSSSLYGSEAIAGVINIITEEPTYKQKDAELKIRYGSNESILLSGTFNYASKKLSTSVFLDRNSTAGYYLGESLLKVIPPHQQYTVQANLGWKPRRNVRLNTYVRAALQDQQAEHAVVNSDSSSIVRDISNANDLNANLALEYKVSATQQLTARMYSSMYATTSDMRYKNSGQIVDRSWFTQQLHRPEIQHQWTLNHKHELVSGIGYTYESVVATRYTNLQSFSSAFAFSSYQHKFGNRITVLGGGRLDVHTVYGNQFNPRLSFQWQVSGKSALKISGGRGFKAPDFRQLYLNFTNASEGYTVLGTMEVKDQYALMQQQGVISQPLTDIESLKPLQAESSRAINISWKTTLHKNLNITIGVFRNDIRNMIVNMPIAIKTNGQSVFSYFNLSSVYTQGFEAEIYTRPFRFLKISAGYQYLIAKDKQVLSDLEAGKYFTRDPLTYKTTKLDVNNYGGLFNRSKHMGNIKVAYENKKHNVDLNLRGIYRGRYGYGDLNGNLILDQKEEYVNSYWVWNFTVGKRVYNRFYCQAGIENILDFTAPVYVPTLPGRIYYLSVSAQLWKKNTTNIKQ